MKDSEILKLAKEKLWLGPVEEPRMDLKFRSVCASLWAVDQLGNGPQAAALRAGIMESLKPHHNVVSWVCWRLNKRALTINQQEAQNYRHAWMDHMIAECEKKGN